MTNSAPPLDGITVLDFTHALAGPYCTMLMAAYGANVIKVENPGEGDIGRAWGPPFQGADSAYFVGLNSGKKSLAVDLKSPEGLASCRELAARADIVIENFRPGTMNRLGLDYSSLSAANPRLIYISISGYGLTGPRRLEPAMDLIIQSASGLMSITGTTAGETVRSGHSVADVTAGLFALIGALMALEVRHRTGRGQFVDVSMMDGLMSTMVANFARYLASGEIPGPLGTVFGGIVPYRNYLCADREITIAVASDKLWKSFCEAIGRTDLSDHPEYRTNPLRVLNRAVLEPILEPVFRSRSAAHWVEILSQHGVPCTQVRNLKEVIDDEQTRARNMTPVVQHAAAGPIRVLGVPIQLSETPGRIASASPLLGADSQAARAIEIKKPTAFRNDIPFVKDLGIEFLEADAGRATIALALSARHLNSWNVAHGGVVMTLLDVAMAVAGRSLDPTAGGGITVEMKVSFLQPGLAGTRLIASGHAFHRSATMAFCEGEVRDGEDRLIAKSMGTFKYIRQRPTSQPADGE
jgi:formyl-CoA transferase/CoA:oxalate CoA-transferase